MERNESEGDPVRPMWRDRRERERRVGEEKRVKTWEASKLRGKDHHPLLTPKVWKVTEVMGEPERPTWNASYVADEASLPNKRSAVPEKINIIKKRRKIPLL